ETTKHTIIERTETIISDISQIDDEDLRVFILTKNKVLAIWENIHEIYQYHAEISEDITDFINNSDNAERLSALSVPKKKDEKGKMPFIQMWKDILASPNLSIDSFKLI